MSMTAAYLCMFAIFGGVAMYALLGWLYPLPKRLVSWAKFDEFYYDLYVEFGDGSVVVYRGNGTVWHRASSGDRCSSAMESWLCCRWKKIRWGESEILAARAAMEE